MSVATYNNSYETFEDVYNEDSRSNQFEQNNFDSEEEYVGNFVDTDDASETEYKNENRHNNNNNNNNIIVTNSSNNNANTNNSNNTSSATTNGTSHNNELKEQMYQLKLASLNKQVEELKQMTHPEYVKRLKKLEYQLKQRLHLNEVYRDYLKKTVEQDYNSEMKAAQKEYEEKKIDLKDNILTDLEERKKQIETERFSLELTTDSMEIKPTITRKLRRRPNDPVPVVEKRRKPTTGQLLVYLLDEKDIENDLKTIQRGKPLTPTLQQNGINAYPNNLQQQNAMMTENLNTYVDTKIEDNKLWYERRWFCRGQQVYVEGRDISKFPATITAIGNEAIWVKKTNDTKVKISVSHLVKGKVAIKRRAN